MPLRCLGGDVRCATAIFTEQVNRSSARPLIAYRLLKSKFPVLSPFNSERNQMNKLIAALVAGLFATAVYAQTPAPATPAAAKAEVKAEKADAKAGKAEAKED